MSGDDFAQHRGDLLQEGRRQLVAGVPQQGQLEQVLHHAQRSGVHICAGRLQQGTVDGQENPLSVITSAKLEQVQKYLSLTGHVYSPALILMSKAQFDKLSPADQQAFIDAAKEAVKANRARIDDDEKRAVGELRAKGMAVVDTLDKSKFQTALTPVYADFAKKFGQENIDRIKNYK